MESHFAGRNNFTLILIFAFCILNLARDSGMCPTVRYHPCQLIILIPHFFIEKVWKNTFHFYKNKKYAKHKFRYKSGGDIIWWVV